MNTAKFITEVTVVDPDSMGEVEVSMFKHNESGGIFGVDSSYLDQCFEDDTDPVIPDPFNEGDEVTLLGL
jgi:hypothetical protein